MNPEGSGGCPWALLHGWKESDQKKAGVVDGEAQNRQVDQRRREKQRKKKEEGKTKSRRSLNLLILLSSGFGNPFHLQTLTSFHVSVRFCKKYSA